MQHAAAENATVNLGVLLQQQVHIQLVQKRSLHLKWWLRIYRHGAISYGLTVGVSAADAYDVSGTALAVTGGIFNDFIDVSGMTAAAMALLITISNGCNHCIRIRN